MGKRVAATMKKKGNGYNAVVTLWERAEYGTDGETIFNRGFKIWNDGEEFVAVFDVSASGRRKLVKTTTLNGVSVNREVRVNHRKRGGKQPVQTEAAVQEKSQKVNLSGYYISPEARLVFNTAHKLSGNRPEKAVKLMMVGASGYGKTTLPFLFASLTGRNFLRMNCATIRDPEEWFGYREAREGSTVFIRSQFAKVIEEGNVVVVLDEFNRLEPWLHNTLFPLLDDDGRTVVHDEEFHIGSNVVVVGTINTGYKYTGTFELDEALLNRFDFVLEVGALPHNDEVDVLVNRTGISRAFAGDVVKVATTLRSMDVTCSTRTTLLIAQLFNSGMTLREAFESAVVRRIPVDSNGGGLRKQVIDTINIPLGTFEPRKVKGDIFDVQVEEEKPVQLPHSKVDGKQPYILLEAASGLTLLPIQAIKALRSLPTVGKTLNGLTQKEAKDLVEQIQLGGKVTIDLLEKPADFKSRIVPELQAAGLTGVLGYRTL